MVSAAVSSAASASDNERSRFTAAPPTGFEQLEAERELVLDLYYGGEKRGTARVAVYGDRIEFTEPAQVLLLVNDAANQAQVLSQLQQPLPAHRELACGLTAPAGCGIISSQAVSVILDEDGFRIDLFIAPALRNIIGEETNEFLATPQRRFSVVSLTGATLSGSDDWNQSQYRFQNRTIAAFGNGRIRSDASLEKDRGIRFDNLVMEVDHRDLRFSVGEFWVPGTDLISRRKSLGVGLASQFDTRRNKELLLGTPVEVFLGAPSRVEAYVNGQLISSQILTAGNRQLDTSKWPSGSYEVVLRVFEPGRSVREERHFFSRNDAIAPVGHPDYQLYAGVYSNGSTFRVGTPFVQGALGYRVNNGLAVRASAIATKAKAIADVSATLVSKVGNLTAGGVISTKGDIGVVLRGYTLSLKGVSASFDIRKMWNGGRGPLLPYSTRAGSYDELNQTTYDQGSSLQILGQMSARVKSATVRFSGYYRATPEGRASYSVGPSADLPLYRSNRFSIVAEGDTRKSDYGFNSYVGIRLLLTSGSKSLAVRGGIENSKGQPARLRGEVQGALYGQRENSYWSANAAVGQNDTATYARAAGEARTSLLNARGELLHDFRDSTQYSLSAETGFVLGSGHAALGAGITKDAALVASTEGAGDEDLDIYVNHSLAGTAKAGRSLVVYLDPYREYDVEARPHGAALLSTDFSPRHVVAYPGSVLEAKWEAVRIVVLIGRLMDRDGQALGGISISGPHGVAETDAEGYFQIDAAPSETIKTDDGNIHCQFKSPNAVPGKGYVKLGEVACH